MKGSDIITVTRLYTFAPDIWPFITRAVHDKQMVAEAHVNK